MHADEVEQLASSLDRLLSRRYAFNARAASLAFASPLPAVWNDIAELGLFSFLIPEEQDGFGGDFAQLQPVIRRLGSALLVAPWLANLLASRAISSAASPADRVRWLPPMAAGKAAYALVEGLPGIDRVDEPRMQAALTADGWRLAGDAEFVLHGASATAYLVWAEIPARARNGLFHMERDQSGIDLSSYRAVDGSMAADLRAQGAVATLLDGIELERHSMVYSDMTAAAIAALCSEAVGILDSTFRTTVAYLKTRRQFGKPLADNQSLRHRVADMYIALEQIRSITQSAMESLASADAAKREKTIAQAKLIAGKQGKWIAQQAIQLHGGMGMTDECIVGHYYRRMLVIDSLFGNEQLQLEKLVSLAAASLPIDDASTRARETHG